MLKILDQLFGIEPFHSLDIHTDLASNQICTYIDPWIILATKTNILDLPGLNMAHNAINNNQSPFFVLIPQTSYTNPPHFLFALGLASKGWNILGKLLAGAQTECFLFRTAVDECKLSSDRKKNI